MEAAVQGACGGVCDFCHVGEGDWVGEVLVYVGDDFAESDEAGGCWVVGDGVGAGEVDCGLEEEADGDGLVAGGAFIEFAGGGLERGLDGGEVFWGEAQCVVGGGGSVSGAGFEGEECVVGGDLVEVVYGVVEFFEVEEDVVEVDFPAALVGVFFAFCDYEDVAGGYVVLAGCGDVAAVPAYDDDEFGEVVGVHLDWLGDLGSVYG